MIDIHDSPGKGIGLRDGDDPIYVRMGGSPGNLAIEYLLKRLEGSFGAHDDGTPSLIIPNYQRGRVWSQFQSESFVGFMLEGGRPPAVYLRERPDFVDEVVDGQQRLNAALDFANGRICALLSGRKKMISWLELTVVERRCFLRITMPVIIINESISDEGVIRLYLKINRGGTPHTKQEIARVEKMLPHVPSNGR